ncbi:unnamed protein product [Parnassius apollo]|uniref:(apollo) hypothetical protein n=1 Tax=Parnassius apollo TaxID=110799 RepID=A0A8S3XP61_PARAO|nr:unnamed protein product [Parnassius apollo]
MSRSTTSTAPSASGCSASTVRTTHIHFLLKLGNLQFEPQHNIDDSIGTRLQREYGAYRSHTLTYFLLKLGNLQFEPQHNIDGSIGTRMQREYELREACALVGVQADALAAALGAAPSELSADSLPPPEAESGAGEWDAWEEWGSEATSAADTEVGAEAGADVDEEGGVEGSAGWSSALRDRLLCAVYARLFTWLVNAVNDAIKPAAAAARILLGVLDEYELESLAHNGLVRLLINYAAERVQARCRGRVVCVCASCMCVCAAGCSGRAHLAGRAGRVRDGVAGAQRAGAAAHQLRGGARAGAVSWTCGVCVCVVYVCMCSRLQRPRASRWACWTSTSWSRWRTTGWCGCSSTTRRSACRRGDVDVWCVCVRRVCVYVQPAAAGARILLGVLDEYELESLAHNGLVRLLINYAAERVQARCRGRVVCVCASCMCVCAVGCSRRAQLAGRAGRVRAGVAGAQRAGAAAHQLRGGARAGAVSWTCGVCVCVVYVCMCSRLQRPRASCWACWTSTSWSRWRTTGWCGCSSTTRRSACMRGDVDVWCVCVRRVCVYVQSAAAGARSSLGVLDEYELESLAHNGLVRLLINYAAERAAAAGARSSLGVLDVYGLESLAHNGLERLLINYAAERVQAAVTAATLRREQDEYAREGLAWTPLPYTEHDLHADLLDAGPESLLGMLRESSARGAGAGGAGADAAFLQRLQRRRHPRLLVLPPDRFQVVHFGGPVVYSARGIVQKNRDALCRRCAAVLAGAREPLLAALFAGAGLAAGGSPRRPCALACRQRALVGALVRRLPAAPRLVRCLRADAALRPHRFDASLLRHQIRTQG